ncbi:rhodanese-like domain-containing protein [Thalassomonas sp. M1454]|uniref:rhodanese-like domain-containing protein n=1 Tax=Thalassomonas sp. M1454 TaxID=2594477 RepID=UPI001180D6C8|nr:rhodanese-like domain-containing protein [Thalassomonas sp. M1454]TRX55893.1 rhodanese-like domain-containing protein [Thalassomonas sp. M1454]
MFRIFIIFSLIAFTSACGNFGKFEKPPEVMAKLSGEVSQQQLLDMQSTNENFLLLDVRTPEEFAAAHIPGAVNISHDELVSNLNNVFTYKDKNIVVYCRSGKRAGIAIDILKENGFRQAHHLSGDMNGWQAAGLKVVTE